MSVSPWLARGVRAGLLLSGATVVLSVLGIAPAFAGLPELPLLAVALLIPVLVLGLTGIRSRSIPGGAAAAALAGALAGSVAGLCFLILDQLFFDSVSQQPEKLANYAASGLPSMRAYLALNGLKNTLGGLLLGAVGGAVLGAVGALLGRFLPRGGNG